MGREVPRVYDCFTFFNELDLLELRLTELSGLVDRFVIVESTLTHMGAPKPLYYADNKERFAAFRDRIIHIVVDDMPDAAAEKDPWVREVGQRNAIARGLSGARPSDRIIVSDLDEIPKPVALRAALDMPWLERRLIGFWCVSYHMRLNLRSGYDHRLGPRLICRRNLKTPDHLRVFALRVSKRPWAKPIASPLASWRALRKFGRPLWPTIIWDGAWHFTSVGTFDTWQYKYASMAHAPEIPEGTVTPENYQSILNSMRKEDMSALPMAVQSDPQRYARWLA
jgi:beta-1,4-mannosyl-glycoprotein beta-1,4-N-acetylglucosaminyltransferase